QSSERTAMTSRARIRPFSLLLSFPCAAVVLLAAGFARAEAPRLESHSSPLWDRMHRAHARVQAVAPGQSMRFPRELLPDLVSDDDFEIEEPGDEVSASTRVGAGLSRGLPGLGPAGPSAFGANQLLNDPNLDPPGSCQSENSIAAHGGLVVAGWNDGTFFARQPGSTGYGYSRDGGATWTDGGAPPVVLPGDFYFGDPSLTV